MTDAESLFALAFTGSDAHRVLWLPLLASLFATTRVKPWMLALAVFAIDRAWPLLAMIGAYEPGVIFSALRGGVTSLPSDIIWLALRFLAMFALVEIGWRLRLMLHGQRPVTTAASAAD
ncbi:hypothetical protein [Parvularcula dongshanensis]|uniref:Uncharacterized protein n=1 Tax=Parvularcula dongshanensis TaxID=1173995 RepID=A0A840I053_9PROT|nr:hypothetical protein [Parvularcula dongshanensis]MBB4657653.1 hypothetical protein [Parvularcula dongshanensis]